MELQDGQCKACSTPTNQNVTCTMADHGGFKFIIYVLTILWHIYSSLINMRQLHILPHI
jgi:hypothetical protein